MKMYLILMADGNWFNSISPTGRIITSYHWSGAHFFTQEELGDVKDMVNANPGSDYYELNVTEPVLSGD